MTKSKSTAQIKEARILESLCDNAAGIVKMDAFYAALYDRKEVNLYFPVFAKQVDGQLRYVDNLWPARPYRPNVRLPDYVFTKKSPIVISENFLTWLKNQGLKYEVDSLPGSWIGVPLIARGRVLGVIVSEHKQEGIYTQRTLEFLTAMANRAAGAIANSRLVESLRIVNQVGQALTSRVRLSKEEILTFIYEQAGELMNTRDMYIALYDQGAQMLSFPLATRDGKREYDWPSRLVDLTAGEIKGLTEEVLINKSPLCPPDVDAWYKEREIKPKVLPVPESWVGVPLLSEDKVLGIISLQNDEVANLFGPDDIEVLQAMAGQASVALENTRLVEQLNVVNEVGQTLAAGIELSRDEILELVYKQIGRLMDTRNMYIAMYDQETQFLSFPLATYKGEREYDWSSRHVDLTAGEIKGLTEEVLINKSPLCPPDVEAWYRERKVKPKVLPVPKSWVGVPIISGEHILGVIALQNDEVVNLYSDDDIEVLQTLAGQAAVAIENARLYETLEERVQERTKQLNKANAELETLNATLEDRVRERTKQLTALQDIGVSITSQLDQLDLEVVLSEIAESASSFMSADFATLFSYNPEKGFELAVRRGKIEDTPTPPRQGGFTASILEQRDPIFIKNTESRKLDVELDFIPGQEVKAFAGIPLIVRDKPVGVLYVSFFGPHEFAQEERNLLGLLANQAAVAVDNAQLYQRLEIRLSTTETQREALQNLVSFNTLAGRFLHKVSNMAGTVPITVDYIQEELRASQPDYDTVSRDLKEIKEQTQNLLDMARRIQKSTQQLKEVGAMTSLQRSSAVELIDRALSQANLSPRWNNQINIRKPYENSCQLQQWSPLILTFETLFIEALVNLISNAIEAMPEGGTLTLDIERSKVASEDSVVLKVADTGMGIPAEDLERIYDISYSKKPGGFGYGLWLVKQTCDATGTQVEVESDVGKGTTFYLTIPLVSKEV